MPLAKHCLLPLDETSSLVLGGMSGGDTTSDNVYLYDWRADRWDRFTTLFEARHSASCIAQVSKRNIKRALKYKIFSLEKYFGVLFR